MAHEQWSAVDEYVGGLLAPHDQVLDAALSAAEEAGLPPIQVSAPQGKLLNLLAKTLGAKRVLEFGTLAGYSTIWLGRALADGGRLITLEADPSYAEVARKNIARAGLDDVEGAGPFDLTFIDADKVHSPDYFAWSLEHSHPGGLIVVDNVVRGGSLAAADSDDAATRAQRHLHEMIAVEPRVTATTIQTVGIKGYDGFTIALLTP
jgi:predicted O-methyltransferase YrrM